VRSTIGIDIAAPPDLVYRLARDVVRWERLLPHYARSRLVRREPGGAIVVDFVARRVVVPWLAIGIPVAWRSRTWHDPATRRLRFVHVAGPTRGMDVTWTIEPAVAGGGSRVEIAHDFRPGLPGFAALVDRAFTRPIAGRTLATMRDLAEALVPDSTDADASGDRPRANH
jgi:ribosome-associated toxin RatA of RatAB toxin-antitoxin module